MRYFFAACDVVTAAAVLVAAFMGLPTRWWPIDGAAVVVALSLAAAAGMLLLPQTAPLGGLTNRAKIVVRVASGIVLAIGLIFVALLAISASHLAGVYGPIGQGGALMMMLVMALAIPYLIALPAAQLVWARKA